MSFFNLRLHLKCCVWDGSASTKSKLLWLPEGSGEKTVTAVLRQQTRAQPAMFLTMALNTQWRTNYIENVHLTGDMLQHLLVTQSCKGQQTSEEARCYKMEQMAPRQPWELNAFADMVAAGKMGTPSLLPRPFTLTRDINRRTNPTLGCTVTHWGGYILTSPHHFKLLQLNTEHQIPTKDPTGWLVI